MSPAEDPQGTIKFDHLGIGEALKRGRYVVPINQREYAWEEPQVTALLSDFTNAINRNRPAYFLGTIVLTRANEKQIPDIADGQQRLATITILLAVIRDWFYSRGATDDANSIGDEFLRKFDREIRDYVPRLTLNLQDNEYFRRRILSLPDSPERKIEPKYDSHEKLLKAAELVEKHIANRVANLSKQHQEAHLNQWVAFLEKTVQVIVLTVPNDLDAFTMFETLNDRGLKTSQVDLVKNFLFSEAKDRISEAQQKWSIMIGALETLDDEDPLSYFRTLLTSLYGLTRFDRIFERVKKNVAGRNQAITFLDTLAEYAHEYVAILSPDSPKWNVYSSNVTRSIEVMNELKVAQIRPLLLSVARHFPIGEANKSFPLFTNWSVRFLIAGGGRGGSLEEAYAASAQQVAKGDIVTAKRLITVMSEIVPSDPLFRAAFAQATVSKSHLARYYLRALELEATGESEPAWMPNEDVVINLEHVLPANASKGWEHVHPQTAAVIYKRLGNMVLMQATKNNQIGNKPFADKRTFLQSSPYLLTQMVGGKIDWGVSEIEERQEKLAEIAVRTWPAK
jgi:hypothetical protein